MSIVALALLVVSWALTAYLFVLLVRVIFDWVQVFARDWRPKGFLLVVAELAYTLTDPPLNLLRRFIPPLRLGAISLDLGFLLLFFGVSILSRGLGALALSV